MYARICLAIVLLSFTTHISVCAADVQEILRTQLPLLGHRNWIVVADAAYPAQVAPGIQSLYVGGDQVKVLQEVQKALSQHKHVKAHCHLDRELEHLREVDAPGITAYREALDKMHLPLSEPSLPHEEIIHRLDSTAQTFRVLILKTDLMLPYTSVFFELDCGYWSAESEQQLRTRAAEASRKPRP